MKHPISIRLGIIARPFEGGLLLVSKHHAVHRIDALSAWIWQHADGTRSVDDLVAGLRDAQVAPNADRSLVFEALDRLADADLLEARVAPPAGVSRRVLLQRLAGVAALAALSSVVGFPGTAGAAEGKCSDEKALLSEIAWLEAEQAAVAELLDDWGDEAELDKETSEEYLAELSLRERARKKAAASYHHQLKSAENDLTECTTEGKKLNVTKREKSRKQHFAGRHEHLNKRDAKRAGRHKVRLSALLSKEKTTKGKIVNTEVAKKANAKNDVKIEKSIAFASEKKAKSLAGLKLRTLHREERAKADVKHFQARREQLDIRAEEGNKHLDQRLVRTEERAKIQSAHYASIQTEQGSKKAGSDDHVLEMAQEDAIKALAAAEQTQKKKAAEAATEQKAKATSSEKFSKSP